MVIRYDSFSEILRTTWTVRIAKLMYRERGGVEEVHWRNVVAYRF
jgi:hypothetical protein